MKLLVTGGTGFVGKSLCPALVGHGHEPVCALRSFSPEMEKIPGSLPFFIQSVDENTDWKKGLAGVEAVIHLAGLAHIRTKKKFDLYTPFFRVNTTGTLNLALQAAESGVKRFVFLSTIGVNGKSNQKEVPFRASDLPAPQNAYAISKFKAEQGLRRIEAQTGMEVVIIRPPLVYGPYAKANFLRLMRLVASGLPLPFANVCNKRSLIGIDNLVDAVITCVTHGNAMGKTFLVSDNADLSIRELVCKIAGAMGKRPRLFPLHKESVKLGTRILGKNNIYDQLWEDLCIDISGIQKDLGWGPRVDVDSGIQKAVDWYLNKRD